MLCTPPLCLGTVLRPLEALKHMYAVMCLLAAPQYPAHLHAQYTQLTGLRCLGDWLCLVLALSTGCCIPGVGSRCVSAWPVYSSAVSQGWGVLWPPWGNTKGRNTSAMS